MTEDETPKGATAASGDNDEIETDGADVETSTDVEGSTADEGSTDETSTAVETSSDASAAKKARGRKPREKREKKVAEVIEVTTADDDLDLDLDEGPDDSKSGPDDRETEGPFDASEANPARPYVDLGGIKVLPRDGLHLRLEVEEGTNRVVAIGLDYAGSTLQVQAFAAPRTTGLWHEIREQIEDQILKQGGTSTLEKGPFGPELVATVPAVAPDGSAATRQARFIGVDGPRWLLRGVIAGKALEDAASKAAVEDLFRSVVVVRGSNPMPPRDLIPLTIPQTAASGTAATGAGTAAAGAGAQAGSSPTAG